MYRVFAKANLTPVLSFACLHLRANAVLFPFLLTVSPNRLFYWYTCSLPVQCVQCMAVSTMSFACSPGTKRGIHQNGISLLSQTNTTSPLNKHSLFFSAVLFSSYQSLLQVLPSVPPQSLLCSLGNRRWMILLSRQTSNCNISCILGALKDMRKPDSNSSDTTYQSAV